MIQKINVVLLLMRCQIPGGGGKKLGMVDLLGWLGRLYIRKRHDTIWNDMIGDCFCTLMYRFVWYRVNVSEFDDFSKKGIRVDSIPILIA